MSDVSAQLDLLKLVVARLETAGLRYMVSGSTAMNFYAEPRMTRDIDIVVELEAGDAAKLIGALGDDFYVDEDTVRDAIDRRSMFNAIHIAEALKVDFIVRKDEPYRIEELSRRRRMRVGGIELWAATPEDRQGARVSKDTTPEIAARYRRMLMARSGDERVQMGCDMLDTAIEMFFSTLPPELPERERRAQLFLRFYGREFTEPERDRIVARLRRE